MRQRSEATLTAALTPFGWLCGQEFWQRYYTDPWVFNLANAVELLVEQLTELKHVWPAPRLSDVRMVMEDGYWVVMRGDRMYASDSNWEHAYRWFCATRKGQMRYGDDPYT